MHHRRHEQRRVGDAAGDHHVGASLQRVDDGTRAEVRDSEHDAVADGAQVGAGVHVAQLDASGAELVKARGDVVARDRGHAHLPQAELARHRAHCRRRRARVHPPGVGDDANPPFMGERQQRCA